MPNMDGIELLNIVKEEWPDKSVIMVSSGGVIAHSSQ